MSHSKVAVTVFSLAAGCMTQAAPSDPAPVVPVDAWANQPVPFVTALDDVTVSYTLSQPTAVDGLVGLSNGASHGAADLGPAIHLDPSGVLQVADGATFRADAVVGYTGAPVAIVMHVDLTTHRYSVDAGGTTIAHDYAFNAAQATLSRIDTLASYAGVAAPALSDISVGPQFCSFAGSAWVDLYHPAQPATYQVRFDARVPATGSGAVVGLAGHDVTRASDLAASIRFANGALIASDGAAYRADHSIAYAPDTTYTFTFAVDVTTGTYSVAVRPQGEGSATTQLATGYAFDQTSGGPLTQVGASASTGYVRVCNLAVWSY